MPRKIADQFLNAFDTLAENSGEELDVKKLGNREGYRLRIGGYRAIYTQNAEHLVILVPVLYQGDKLGFSWPVSVQGKARLEANGHSPLRKAERSHGR